MRPTDACTPTHSWRTFLQNFVTGTSIQSLRRRPITNVHCCTEHFCPKGILACPMVEHGAHGTLVSTPTVHSATPLDAGWCGTGGSACSIMLADVAHLAHR